MPAGFCRLPQELDYSPDSTDSSSAECAKAARIAWGGGRYKLARSAIREQGRSKTGVASLIHVKLSPMSAPGPTGERQEHLDAVVSFAGAGQRRRLFRGLDILTIKWAIGDLLECCFLLNTQLMFVKNDKDRLRSSSTMTSAEAHEATTDILEDSVTYDQRDVDPQESSAC